MPRPILATVSVPALRHNLSVVTSLLAEHAGRHGVLAPKVWAVIKARGYGHGMQQVVQAFVGANGLAMIDLEEIVQCRDLGWQGPLLLLEGFFQAADIALVRRHAVTVVVHSNEQLAMLEAAGPGPAIPVWLKVDTGMGRLGFLPESLAPVLQRLETLQRNGIVALKGMATHFARADDNLDTTREQCDRLRQALAGRQLGASLCNSAGTLQPDVWLPFSPAATAQNTAQGAASSGHTAHLEHWVRPGICLYGASPFHDRPAAGFGLKPAMTLTSELISVKALPKGAGIGYGHHFTAPQAMRVGIVACGYADGYPRHAPTGTPITVHGVPTRLVGRVSMDMLAVDVSGIPQAQAGSPVVLWGEGGPSVDDVGQAAGTIGYELLCAVAPRVPRRVIPQQET